MVQSRSKLVVIIAAMAENDVIGHRGGIPWHVPEDFAHFKRSTLHQTLLMGRTTFDSIGHALPDRVTIVLTRDRQWSRPGVLVAHDLQTGIDLAEDQPGDLMVAGGSHIYAEMLPVAQVQVLSTIFAHPEGDAFYPTWDRAEWIEEWNKRHDRFEITSWYRKPRRVREFEFQLSPEAAAAWWNADWSDRLTRAVSRQRAQSMNPGQVNWTRVHEAAMRVIIEAAEERLRLTDPGAPDTAPASRRLVRLAEHTSMQDAKAVQGALVHWSDFVAPRRSSDE